MLACEVVWVWVSLRADPGKEALVRVVHLGGNPEECKRGSWGREWRKGVKHKQCVNQLISAVGLALWRPFEKPCQSSIRNFLHRDRDTGVFAIHPGPCWLQVALMAFNVWHIQAALGIGWASFHSTRQSLWLEKQRVAQAPWMGTVYHSCRGVKGPRGRDNNSSCHRNFLVFNPWCSTSP